VCCWNTSMSSLQRLPPPTTAMFIDGSPAEWFDQMMDAQIVLFYLQDGDICQQETVGCNGAVTGIRCFRAHATIAQGDLPWCCSLDNRSSKV